MKKKVICGLGICVGVLLVVIGLMISNNNTPLANREVSEIYNTILFDEDIVWDLKDESEKAKGNYEDYYEAENFFEYQPEGITENALQNAYKNVDDSYFALSVVRFDASDEDAISEYEEWLSIWALEKATVMLGATDENLENLRPYLNNSALVRENGLFIILYGTNGVDVLSKYFDDVDQLFYMWK